MALPASAGVAKPAYLQDGRRADAQRRDRLLRARAGSIAHWAESVAAGTSIAPFRAIAKSAIWTSRTRSGRIARITRTIVRARTQSPLGPCTFTNTRRTGVKSGDRRRTRKKSGYTCLTSFRLPEEQFDEGYHFYTHPAHAAAIWQLLEWRDARLISALEDIATRPEVEDFRADIEKTISLVRERLGN